MQFLLVININLGPISHRFRDMASFPLKTHIFSTLLHLTPNLKLFLLHCIPHILYAKGLRRRLIISVKNSLFDSMLTSVTDGRTTEDRQMSDDNCPCSKKFQNFKQNDAFLCKIFTIFGMHPVNRGETPPPESATGQKITFVDLIRTNRPLSSKPSTQFQLCRPVQNKKKLQYPSPDPLYSTIYCSQVHRVGLNSQTAKVCSPETVNRVVKSLVTIERAAYRIEDVLLRLNLLVSLLKTCL